MANQRENRVDIGVKVLDDGTTLARTAGVLSTVRSALGVYLVNLIPDAGIADAEETHSTCLRGVDNGEGGFNPAVASVERVTDVQYRVRTFAHGTGAAGDSLFSLMIYRVGP
jgi:hypothetical protein